MHPERWESSVACGVNSHVCRAERDLVLWAWQMTEKS
jgi:hypothetical protein